MMHRARHLQDDRLFECYLAERDSQTIDPPVAEHLADCESCSARYADLVRFLDTLRTEGIAEADAVFTPERLRAQQQNIAQRIAHIGRPARVISFPAQLVRRTIAGSASRTAPRWIAAAAAAGLFVGVALGASYEWNAHLRSARQILAGDAALTTRLLPVAARGNAPAEVAADDAFLSELEIALERPRTRELQAFDALTPHVREISDQR